MKLGITSQRIVKCKSTGFTLIELLVVIAIIGLLAAILFPVFGRARENARRSACQSNLKQMGLGMAQYTQDYDEYMTPVYTGTGTSGTIWQELVQPYVQSRQIFLCPSNTTKLTGRNSSIFAHYYGNGGNVQSGNVTNTSWAARRPMDMTDSGANGGVPASTDPVDPTKLAQIQLPAQCLLVYESQENQRETWDYKAGNIRMWGHLKMMNVLFADGHVKAIKPTQTYPVSNAPTTGSPNMWTADPLAVSSPLASPMKSQEANLG